jgi:hypothetical protein
MNFCILFKKSSPLLYLSYHLKRVNIKFQIKIQNQNTKIKTLNQNSKSKHEMQNSNKSQYKTNKRTYEIQLAQARLPGIDTSKFGNNCR